MTERRSGFILIELLVTIVLLAPGLVALSSLFVAGIILDMKAERCQVATNRVRQERAGVVTTNGSITVEYDDVWGGRQAPGRDKKQYQQVSWQRIY
jgi:Tfp pilus assembly protein PilV